MNESDDTRVYLVTGDDDRDDPARGHYPVFAGDEASVVAWLRDQFDVSQYSVLRGIDVRWASDFLERRAPARS